MTSGPPPRPPAETGPTDAQLLSDHAAGSPTAFGTLVARHQHHLWAVALRMMRSQDDAADVLQDAMIKAFRAAPGYRGEAAVSTWLHRIVVNTSLDALRSRSRAPVLAFDHVAVAEARADPRDAVAQRETSLDVTAALAAIPVDQRAAVVLVDMVGFSVAEAADILQCPPGTVKSRCSRARARLAEMLAGYDSACRTGELSPGSGNRPVPPDVEQHGAAAGEPATRTEEQT